MQITCSSNFAACILLHLKIDKVNLSRSQLKKIAKQPVICYFILCNNEKSHSDDTSTTEFEIVLTNTLKSKEDIFIKKNEVR